MPTSRSLAILRSNGQCEAMVVVGKAITRCGVRPVEVHHRVRRSQGGKLLDKELEIHHLISLCHKHHTWAHRDTGTASEAGLFIEGQVLRDGMNIIYKGPDEVLNAKYGEEARYEIRGLGSNW